MDYGKAISYVFEDKDWVTKILLGGVIFAVPILNFAAFGYALEVLRNVSLGKEKPLPDWDDIGDKFVKGFLFFVSLIIYGLPLIIIAFIFITIAILLGIAFGSNSSDIAGGLIAGISCLGYIFYLAYGLFIALILPEIAINFSKNYKIKDAIDIKNAWHNTKENIGTIIIILLISYAINAVAGFGIIFFVIGVFFTSFLAYLMVFHLYGQLAKIQK